MIQPNDVRASHGWSEITWKPAGSCGHGPLPGGTTVTTAVPKRPSAAAVIVAVPGATAVTTPFASTTAVPGSLVVHAIGVPGIESPAESNGVACHRPAR